MNTFTLDRRLAALALLLTMAVSIASAFLRLSPVAAGCLPGANPALATDPQACRRTPPAEAVVIARTVHRVSATVVGALVLVLAWRAWRGPARLSRTAGTMALVVTLGLSVLGRYTPSTLPAVTLGNVAGGLLLCACLAWLWRRTADGVGPAHATPRAVWPAVGLIGWLLVLAATGTLIGVRGAIAGCPDALCVPAGRIDWRLFDPSVIDAAVGRDAARVLHGVHRLLVLLVLAPVIAAAWRGWYGAPLDARLGLVVLALCAVQVALGIAVTLGADPGLVGAAHNAAAAGLIAALSALLAGERSAFS